MYIQKTESHQELPHLPSPSSYLGEIPFASTSPTKGPVSAGATVGSLIQRLQSALASGQWYLALTLAALSGERDKNRLTNMLFFARHPERNGRKLDPGEPNFKQLSREWGDIRDRLVQPFLEKSPSTGPVAPSQPSRPGVTPSSNNCVQSGSCTACERRLRAVPPPQLVSVPTELLYYPHRQERLDTQALQAYQRLVQDARGDGIPSPYLKLVSGYRDYDRQAGLWRERLLVIFQQLGCSSSSLPCLTSAINRTTAALKSQSMPHPEDAWLARFLREVGPCDLGCDPREAVRILRQGTAPPGRSPHHTGRAIDIHVGGRLSTQATNVAYQRQQEAYRWLVCHAARFGFYPYHREPWHWEYNPPT